MSSKNRRKGHNLERKWKNIFKDILGFKFCKTSRQASRLLDDSKVDLAFIPFNVQCKKGYTRGINYTQVFEEMEQKLKENFPPESVEIANPPIIVHDKGRKKYEKLVVIQEDDFIKLLKKIYNET